MLKTWFPDIPLLGEEMSHVQHCDVMQGSKGCFWTLDPLDGTTNFVAGFPFYGISLALIKDFRPYLAVVYDPLRKELFSAERGKGAQLNGVNIKAGARLNCSVVLPMLTTSVLLESWPTGWWRVHLIDPSEI